MHAWLHGFDGVWQTLQRQHFTHLLHICVSFLEPVTKLEGADALTIGHIW